MGALQSARRPAAGFTLLEVLLVVSIMAVLIKVAMMKGLTPATLTLHAQAQSVAETVRRAQSLALVRGERMQVLVTSGSNGTVAVACAASGSCGTHSSYSVEQGVSLGSVGPLFFSSLGQPINSTGTTPLSAPSVLPVSHTVGSGQAAVTTTFNVTVAPLTGRVTVSP